VSLLDFIERSNQCNSKEDLIQVFEHTIADLGFDKFVYSLMRGSFSKTGRTQHGVARSYPENWMAHYVEKNYINNDPTYRYALRHKGAFAWRHLQNVVPLTKNEKSVMDEAEDAGLYSGVSLSVHGPLGEVMGFGFASNAPKPEPSKNQMSMLHAAANQFHLVFSGLDQDIEEPELALSDRQRDVLQWSALGKSRSVVAEILGISDDTVNDHFRLIFKADSVI
jgi:hypothetical protein